MSSTQRHQPLHIYYDNAYYFISVHTFDHQPILHSDERKQLLITTLNRLLQQYHYHLFVYVILDDHYHLLCQSNKGADLKNIFQKLHGSLSFIFNQEDNARGRKIFPNYWDRFVRSEYDFYLHFNYIHNNPIKHENVRNLAELPNYKFSSYNTWIKKKGIAWILDCWRKFPIRDFSVDNE